MSVKPLWQCREFEGIYQISAIVRDGDCVFRECQQISKVQLEDCRYPELLISSAIQITANNLYYSMERAK